MLKCSACEHVSPVFCFVSFLFLFFSWRVMKFSEKTVLKIGFKTPNAHTLSSSLLSALLAKTKTTM